MPDSLRKESTRVCAECGMPLLRGDGGIRAFGHLFCSELCADRVVTDEMIERAARVLLAWGDDTTQRSAACELARRMLCAALEESA